MRLFYIRALEKGNPTWLKDEVKLVCSYGEESHRGHFLQLTLLNDFCGFRVDSLLIILWFAFIFNNDYAKAYERFPMNERDVGISMV